MAVMSDVRVAVAADRHGADVGVFPTMRWPWRRCAHRQVRCVHGDEINAVGGRRVFCYDCCRYLKDPLPTICSHTGRPH